MLERLVLRPELTAFEKVLRDRLDRVALLEDERLARPRTIERDADGGLVVISEFVPGSRLADVLDTCAQAGTAPGIDAALGYLLDVLPALCGLHAGAGFAHGAITPSRTVLTPAGQVVLLDVIYGGAISHLRYGRQRLWTTFGIAVPTTARAPRLDVQADIAQVALCAMLLVLGRPLDHAEYPGRLRTLAREVADVAQIRATSAFGRNVRALLERALLLSPVPMFASADDALIEVRELASEMGAHTCRQALLDFIQQMEPSTPAVPAGLDLAAIDVSFLDADLETVEDDVRFDADPDEDAVEPGDEIDLESLSEPGSYDLDALAAVDLAPPGSTDGDGLPMPGWPGESSGSEAPSAGTSAAPSARQAPARLDAAALDDFASEIARHAAPATLPVQSPPSPAAVTSPHQEPVFHVPPAQDPQPLPAATAPEAQGPVPFAAPEPLSPPVAPAVPVQEVPTAVSPARESPAVTPGVVDAAVQETPAEPSVRSRRAKRTRSARARKDRLRSAAAPSPAPSVKAKAPSPAPEPSSTPAPSASAEKPAGSWLVPPERAVAFEPPVPVSGPAPPGAVAPSSYPGAPPPTPFAPPASSYGPAVPPLPPSPFPPGGISTVVPTDSFGRPVVPGPSVLHAPVLPPSALPPAPSPAPLWVPQPTPQVPAPALQPVQGAPQLTPLKLKASVKPRPVAPPPDIYSTPVQPADRSRPAVFPKKLAMAALGLTAAAILAGRALLWSERSTHDENLQAAPPAATAPAPDATTGKLQIETQPAGARVLLDGKPAGESPVLIDAVPAGRHAITIVAATGSVKRTVRVEAGRTTSLDIPIFSGWVAIYAPFVVEVSEDGRVIGTTEEPRLMLSPGRHALTLTNKDLEYRSTETVDIEPGEVRTIRLDPRGTANLNATPWAEVWIEGRKVGDTPIANHPLPLGVREVVFRHPVHGERRVTLTVKGRTSAAVSVDMSRP